MMVRSSWGATHVEPMSYDWHLYVLDLEASGGLAAGPKQLWS